MNPRQLEAFLATVRVGSVTGAARRLGVSQPSVSRLIVDLERAVGFKLFTRAGRGLVTTREGRRFQRAVESLYTGLGRLDEVAQAIRTSGEALVSLGLISVFARSDLLEAVRDLHGERPTLRIAVSVRTNEEVIDAVRMQQLDLGVVSALHSLEGLHIFEEQAVRYVCLVPHGHALAARRDPIDLEALANEDLVALPAEYVDAVGPHAAVARRLEQRARLTSHSMPAVASLARLTGSLAVVDPFTAQVAEALGGMTGYPLVQNLRFPVAVVGRGIDALPAVGLDLAERLAERLRGAAAGH